MGWGQLLSSHMWRGLLQAALPDRSQSRQPWAPYPKELRDRSEKQFSGYGVSPEHLPRVVVKEPVPVLVGHYCYGEPP